MKNPFSKIAALSSRFSANQISLFCYRFYRRVFLLFFACISVFGAWYWYYNLYQYAWDERTKKTFLDSYVQETDFKENIFNKTVSEAQERQQRYESDMVVEHDFFQLDKLVEETE